MADLTGTKSVKEKRKHAESEQEREHVPERQQKKMKEQDDRGMSEWRLSGSCVISYEIQQFQMKIARGIFRIMA